MSAIRTADVAASWRTFDTAPPTLLGAYIAPPGVGCVPTGVGSWTSGYDCGAAGGLSWKVNWKGPPADQQALVEDMLSKFESRIRQVTIMPALLRADPRPCRVLDWPATCVEVAARSSASHTADNRIVATAEPQGVQVVVVCDNNPSGDTVRPCAPVVELRP